MTLNMDQYRNFTNNYLQVWEILKDIPGLQGIGLGLKEIGGVTTNRVAWRLYVKKKLPIQDLEAANVLPTSLFGHPTDVLSKSGSQLTYGNNTVPVLRPGVEIKGAESGTLGCFAIRRGRPDQIVILSNSHVIYSDSAEFGISSDVEVGQPKTSCCCCCKCRVIGTARRADSVHAFGPEVRVNIPDQGFDRGYEIDAAIADFNRARDYTNEIEGVGMITGTPSAGNLGLSNGDSVTMIGATSGLVRGKVLAFNYNAQYTDGSPVPNVLFPFNLTGSIVSESMAGARPNINQFVFIADPDVNDPNRKMIFGQDGDSGSVVVNSQRQVVALFNRSMELSAEDASNLNPNLLTPLPVHAGGLGFANPIHKVLDNLNIDIPDNLHGTKVSSGATIMVPSLDSKELTSVSTDEWLSKKADDLEWRVKMIPLGQHLIEKIAQHRPEVFRLVNFQRPVTVAWHRYKGPAFIAHCLKSVIDSDYKIPLEVEGISRELLIKRMVAVLKEFGSEALAQDIDAAYPAVMQHINKIGTSSEMIELLQFLSSQPIFEEIA